ncbi:hypothetical protein ACH47Z_14085 [Streptomyces sp. NPDC020192]|uniref:hypothetical protein n=1 Tax=Streptomyces sp. NPDC020192 TaxID=3365066 RepID=UPI0037B773A7
MTSTDASPAVRRRRMWWAGGGLFASAACVLGVAGGVVAVVVRFCAPALLACGGMAALGGRRSLRAVWVLRTRGVVAEGRLESSYVESVEDALVRRHVSGLLVFGVVLLLVFGIPVLVGGAGAAVFAVLFAFG